MGKIDTPRVPIAYVERQGEPQKPATKGVRVWPGHEGKECTFWGDSYAEAIIKCKQAGYPV